MIDLGPALSHLPPATHAGGLQAQAAITMRSTAAGGV